MFEWLQGIISSVSDFFNGFIDSTVKFFEYLSFAKDYALTLVGFLPAWLKAFAIITITVSVIYLVIGRDSGGD